MNRLQPFTPATVSAPDVTRMSRAQSGGPDAGARQLLRFVLPTAGLIVLVVTLHQIAQPDVASVYRDPLVRLVALAAALLAVLVGWRFVVGESAPARERLVARGEVALEDDTVATGEAVTDDGDEAAEREDDGADGDEPDRDDDDDDGSAP